MMTKNLIIRTIIMSLTLIILLGNSSCTNSKNEKEESKSTIKEVKTLEKPTVDLPTAVFMGNTNAIKQHINNGTVLNTRDAYGSTPLNIAITFGKTDIANMLINGGADINATNADGSTPLHTASFFCRTEIVETLLKNGADKTIKNHYGSTALESVSANFEDVKPIYMQIAKDLGPLGLRLDLKRIETTRPLIAKIISE
ncbi:MAG: ankyrin repeat domain-containing protein [Marinilabiliales bacterium]|nr:MAG: ankyrin repeat domain-containing protein [Marinilabiliales bacterium]